MKNGFLSPQTNLCPEEFLSMKWPPKSSRKAKELYQPVPGKSFFDRSEKRAYI